MNELTGLVRRMGKGSSFGYPVQNIISWPARAANQKIELLLGSTLYRRNQVETMTVGILAEVQQQQQLLFRKPLLHTSNAALCCCSWWGAALQHMVRRLLWLTQTTMAAPSGVLDQTGGADQALWQADPQ